MVFFCFFFFWEKKKQNLSQYNWGVIKKVEEIIIIFLVECVIRSNSYFIISGLLNYLPSVKSKSTLWRCEKENEIELFFSLPPFRFFVVCSGTILVDCRACVCRVCG